MQGPESPVARFELLILDDDAERRQLLHTCFSFIGLHCHVFDFVAWLQQGKDFDLSAVGLVLVGESSLPIAMSKLIAELDMERVRPSCWSATGQSCRRATLPTMPSWGCWTLPTVIHSCWIGCTSAD